MPLITVRTSVKELKSIKDLQRVLSKELAELTGKPEKYVMTIIQEDQYITLGGDESPCCYVEVKSIGALNPPLMTKLFCKIISEMTDIPSSRIYISFEDVPANKWGFNGSTFA